MKEGWEIKKLGEVCDIICGQDYKSVKDDNGKYPIYGTGGIMGYASQYRCPANSVIIGRKGNINNPIYVETDFWNVDTAFGVVPKSEIIHPKFFYLFCKDYDFTKHDVSVTIPSLRRTDIIKIDVPIPPLAEQEKIVAELDCLSGIIEKKKQQLKEYDALAQSIFYEMFGDPVENEKGWEVKKMNEVAKIAGGYAFKSNLFIEEGIPVLRIGNINTGRLKTDSIVFYQENSALAKYLVYPGDLVMSLTGTVGKDDYGNVCVLDNAYSKYYLNQRNAKFMLSENIQVDYLKYFLKDTQIKSKLTGVNRGVRQGNISNKDIEGLIVPTPPLALQQEFASKIEAIEKQKALLQKSIEEVETLFKSRMDQYFNS